MHKFNFFINPESIKENKIIIKEKELIRRISKVLRLNIGDNVNFLDNQNNIYNSKLIKISSTEISAEIIDKQTIKPQFILNLYPSLIQKQEFELLAEKASEIGISSLTPLIAERSQLKTINLERIKKIVKQSAEQSKKILIPKINPATKIEKINQGIKIVLSQEGKNILEIKDKIKSSNEISLITGPEGDFTQKEIEFFKKNNFELVSISSSTLKSETAAILACFIINFLKSYST